MNRKKEAIEENGIKQTWLSERPGKIYNIMNGYFQNDSNQDSKCFLKSQNILQVDPKEMI
jgi:putative transcriptional regulator